MPFSNDLIRLSVDRYLRERDRYSKLADRIAEICRTEICEANAIRAQVVFRVKSAKSFEEKLYRFSKDDARNYSTVDDVFSSISDLAAVRIATYRHEDCGTIEGLIKEQFRGKNGGEVHIEAKDKSIGNDNNFYRAIHAQVWLAEDELLGTYDNLGDTSCEIQICTMISHVWNEIEHDIGYKPSIKPSFEEQELLKALGNTVRVGDQLISLLLKAHDKHITAQQGNFRDVHDFITRSHKSLSSVAMISKNSGQLFEQLELLGIKTPKTLSSLIRDDEVSSIKAEIQEFNRFLEKNNAPLMDENSSDVILLTLFRQKLSEIFESHQGRVGRGLGRPNRLYRLALQYKTYTEQEK